METVILMVSAVIIPGLCVGLVVSVFQAATQINEQTLSFIPRLLIALMSLIFFSPWLLKMLLNFTEDVLSSIGTFIT